LRQIIQLCSKNDGFKCNWNKDQYSLQQIDDSDVSILCREVSGKPKDSGRCQLVVPKELQSTCMKLFHEGFSHPGSQRCLDTIKLYYYWDGMRKDIINHVGECVPCRLRKAYQGRPMIPIMKYPRVYRPLERLHFDLTGPLVSTKSGFKYILVVKDYLTKYVWLFPLKFKTAEEVAEKLVNEIICRFGVPT
jgi:hypothetical protein